VVAFFSVLTVALFAGAARRLLGVPVGWARTVAASIGAFALSAAVTEPIAAEMSEERSGAARLSLGVLNVGIAVILAMTILVIAEALVPSASIPPAHQWIATLRRRRQRLRRYGQIIRLALRHRISRTFGRRWRHADADTRRQLAADLRTFLDDAGVTFVKLGQMLSTRRDLVPEEVADELATLQEHVTAVPWEQIERVLVDDLGAPVADVFAAFDRTPVAAASIAQVHRARLHTGEPVVVKVQRSAIRDVVERDLDIVGRVADRIGRTSWGGALGAPDLAAGFAASLREELDFRVEASNLATVRQLMAVRGGEVVVPAPFDGLCTERVLVMERVDGQPLGATLTDASRAAERRTDVARALLGELLTQIAVDGVFHADPHPGNAMLLADGRVALLDFGSVGRLDGSLRGSLQELLLALDREDPAGVTDALLDIVARPGEVDERRLERAIGTLMARHLRTRGGSPAQLFADLSRLITRLGVTIPPELAAVFRSLATLDGTLTQLDPTFDVVDETRRLAATTFLRPPGPATVEQLVRDELLAALPRLRRIPRRIDRIGRAVEQGRLEIGVRVFADERDRRDLAGAVQQLQLTVLAATAAVVAALLLGTSGGPDVTDDTRLYEMMAYLLFVVSAVLALRVLAPIFRRRHR
jgi:ubiquinone biosynthesis protein